MGENIYTTPHQNTKNTQSNRQRTFTSYSNVVVTLSSEMNRVFVLKVGIILFQSDWVLRESVN